MAPHKARENACSLPRRNFSKCIEAIVHVESVCLSVKPVETAPKGHCPRRTGMMKEAVMVADWSFTRPKTYNFVYHPVDVKASSLNSHGCGSRKGGEKQHEYYAAIYAGREEAG